MSSAAFMPMAARTRDPMRFTEHGAERLDAAALPMLREIKRAVAGLPPHRPGVRLSSLPALSRLLGPDGGIGSHVRPFCTDVPQPVRAVLFDKTEANNWSLAWHQERTICVRERRAVAEFGPWTIKSGLLHVAPPFALLAQMVTIRIHLDDVPPDNAPLLIAPGSHRVGLVREERIDAVVAQCGMHVCTALAGDIWIYATPILHASETAATPRRRRVLQVDYAEFDLPGGLEWSGV